MRRSPVLLGTALLALVTVPGQAQSVADLERRLLPFRNTLAPTAGFWEALADLRSLEERQQALRADILFGLSGDEAGERSLYKLNTGIAVSRGDYPSELSVDSRLGLQLRDGMLQEDVTTLRITYDYHTSRTLQYSAFAERFTDNFLSIQQRYEIGFGARLAWPLGFVGDEAELDRKMNVVRTGLTGMTGVASNPASLTSSDLQRFGRSVDELDRSIRDTEARLLFGIAVSVFSEIERASLDVMSVPLVGPIVPGDSLAVSIAVPSRQRYRLSIRPTFRWRPAPDVRIQVFPYFKLPLNASHRVPDPGDSTVRRYDFRRDIYSELAWTLRSDQTGLENVQFVLTLNHFLDNVPPSLSARRIAEEAARGRVFVRTYAERTHSYVSLALRVRW